MSYVNIMVDLETLSTAPNAAIASIGAVVFSAKKIEHEFYRAIDINSSVKAGGHLDPETIIWWMKQGEEARNVFRGTPDDISSALYDFKAWIESFDRTPRIWGNGASFDNVILCQAFKNSGIIPPWKFWDDMCYRTRKNMNPEIKHPREGVHHNALDDARYQAEHLILIMEAESD